MNPNTNNKDTTTATNITRDASQICTATLPVVAGAVVTWTVQSVSNGSASYPLINVLENPIPSCGNPGNTLTFCGKVFLQGPFDSAARSMRTTLNSQGILQRFAVNHPYSIAPFNYTGLEAVGAGFFAAHPDIIDWVLLELRDANAPLAIVSKRAVFLNKDGTLVDTGGINKTITFKGVSAGRYYVAVQHRNHLGIRTSTAIDFASCSACYDFTTGNFKSFRNQEYTSPEQKGTAWVMRGGDATMNRTVLYSSPGNDQTYILNALLGGSLSGMLRDVYSPGDLNMNGMITWSGPDNEQTFLLNTVLSGFLSGILTQQF